MADPGALFAVRQGDHMSSVASACVASLLQADPATSISVWHPRPNPTARSASRLKFYNATFMDLCDTPNFKDGSVSNVAVCQPVFISEDTARLVAAGMERCYSIVDAIHAGKVNRGRSTRLHVSKLGRQRRIAIDVIGIWNDDSLVEFIIAATFLHPEQELSADLHDAYDMGPVIRAVPAGSRAAAGQKELRWTNVEAGALLSTFEAERLRKLKSMQRQRVVLAMRMAAKPAPVPKDSSAGWGCTMCGITSTTQKRCVLCWSPCAVWRAVGVCTCDRNSACTMGVHVM